MSLPPDFGACTRCLWCEGYQDYIEYHDHEWGYPEGEDHALFEKMCLELFQSGLSWLTILRKRKNFRRAFQDFDFRLVRRFSEREVVNLLSDSGIVRSRAKIEAVIHNARRMQDLIEERGSFAAYLWSFVPPFSTGSGSSESCVSQGESAQGVPASLILHQDLKRRGWTCIGPVTCQSFLESAGLINGHVKDCYMREKIEELRNHFVQSFHLPEI